MFSYCLWPQWSYHFRGKEVPIKSERLFTDQLYVSKITFLMVKGYSHLKAIPVERGRYCLNFTSSPFASSKESSSEVWSWIIFIMESGVLRGTCQRGKRKAHAIPNSRKRYSQVSWLNLRVEIPVVWHVDTFRWVRIRDEYDRILTQKL